MNITEDKLALSLIPNYFDINFLSESKSYFKLSLFECITQSLLPSMEEIKLIAIVS